MFDLIEELSELVYIVDIDTYELLYMNRAGRDMFGLEDISNIKCYRGIQGKNEPCEFCNNNLLEFDKFCTWKHLNPVLNRYYLLKDKYIEWKGRKARIEIAFDMTAGEQERIKLKNTLNAANLVNDCAHILYTSKNVKAEFNEVLRRIGEFLESQRTCIFEITDGIIDNTYEWCSEGVASQKKDLKGMPVKVIDRWMELFERHECVIIKDVSELKDSRPEEYKLISDQGVRSLIAAPISSNDRITGFIGACNYAVDKLDNTPVVLSSIGYFMGATLENFQYIQLLKQMSYRDSLTKVGNRNAFNKHTSALKRGPKCAIGVVYIDVNGMKLLNDQFGHQKGDETLVDVANKIRTIYRSDFIYRIGGDEFVIICENPDEDEFKLHAQELKSLFALEKKYAVSIGAYWTEQFENIQDVLYKADEQMYFDKKNFYHGKALSGRYRHDMDDVLEMTKPGALQGMLEKRMFHVYFQPKITVNRRRLVGAEALVRCERVPGNIMSPAAFIPVLEESRLISLLDFYIFDTVCSYIQAWMDKGLEVQPVSVNFSRYTLTEKNFVRKIQNIWEKYRVPKELVEIEVTETAEEDDFNGFLTVIRAIRKSGFTVSVDDFGVRNANLSLFTAVDFDVLKIDKSLVDDLGRNPKTQAVLFAVSDICHKMGIKLIIEGVETEEQLEVLKDIDCTGVQGFLFSKPIPADQFEERYMRN
ncbi:MAG: sensor domain-containing phosphodiesterase [Clostridium sp.]|nr:sensor domain-containing phosphodiesterase [Clostridium sp.]